MSNITKTLSLLEGEHQDAVFGNKKGLAYGVYDGNKLVKLSFVNTTAKKYAEEKGFTVKSLQATPDQVKELSIKESIKDDQEYFYIQKGLSKKDAIAIGNKMIKKDHRGISYNPETGLIIYT